MCNSYDLPMNKQGVSRVSLKQATACFLFVHRLPSTLFLNNRMGWCTHVFSSLEPYADLLVSPSLHLCDHVTLKEKKGGIKKPQKKKNACWACQYKSTFDSYKQNEILSERL